jgi:hypothetical protein
MSERGFPLRVGLALLAPPLILLALAFVFTEPSLTPRPGVTIANLARIREGMTFDEVKAILGEPVRMDRGFAGSPCWYREAWKGARDDVFVDFWSTDNRVRAVQCGPKLSLRRSLLNRIRDHLRW